MKLRHHRQTNQGMTLVEATVVILIIGSLALLLVPQLLGGRHHRHYFNCSNNLKQVALAFKVWAGDNYDRFPMQVSATNGGALGPTGVSDGLKVFQVMSNELSTPKVIYCSEDTLHRFAATNFTDDLTNKISYFSGADATDASPQMILSGDDNLLLNGSPVGPGLVNVTSPTQLQWDGNRHGSVSDQGWFKRPKKIGAGYIALTDGSVQGTLNSDLTTYLSQTGLATNRLVIP